MKSRSNTEPVIVDAQPQTQSHPILLKIKKKRLRLVGTASGFMRTFGLTYPPTTAHSSKLLAQRILQ